MSFSSPQQQANPWTVVKGEVMLLAAWKTMYSNIFLINFSSVEFLEHTHNILVSEENLFLDKVILKPSSFLLGIVFDCNSDMIESLEEQTRRIQMLTASPLHGLNGYD